VPVTEFRPDKSQRRCERRNSDLRVTHQRPCFSEEKFELYAKYVREWHGRHEGEDESSFESFLYDSPLESTIEFEYRDEESRLLAVGICDQCPSALSSVYFYFDPEEKERGLGTFGAMREIRYAREARLPFYYLGYWVKACGSMEYKRNFRPNEILQTDGAWRRLSD
jgi:arginine-tRNA-protein transferase